MSLMPIIIFLAVIGFIVWIILQIPMPQVFRNIILGVVAFLLVIFILQQFGIATGLPALRLN